MLLFSVRLELLLTLPELEGCDVIVLAQSDALGVATNGVLVVGVRLGVGCEIPMSLGVSFSLGDSRCLAASFRAAGDMLARRSVFVLKLEIETNYLLRTHFFTLEVNTYLSAISSDGK